jgi:uncharacterized membrane protein
VGADRISRDTEIVKVSMPREMLKESTAVVDVSYRSHGFAGRRATLSVRDNGVLLKSEEITMRGDGEVAERSIELSVKNEGPRIFSFSIENPDDRIVENNRFDVLVNVRNERPRILYMEGEPRWDFKFLRRAVEDDPNIQLVTLLRTSQNKFYRQGIDDEEMLAGEFPTTREELFGYKGLIFGSIESTFFSREQLQMVVDFVGNRGGGFLMTGGRNSFGGGRYDNTVIEDLLPVRIPPDDRTPVVGRLRLSLTDYGRTHALMKLSSDPAANAKVWLRLPPLNDFNRTFDAKAGAIVLARGQPEDRTLGSPILLAYQRYGRGRTMTFTSGSSWRWRMEMDHEDITHGLFWKQVLRWLVSQSPDPVMISSDKDTYLPDEQIRLRAEVADKQFNRVKHARVIAKILTPAGLMETLPLDWFGVEDGAYEGALNANEPGIYRVEVEATWGNETLHSYRTTFQVQDRPIEYYNAALNTRLLRGIAAETGGRYYPLAKIGDLPNDAIYVDGETSFIEQKEVWDAPFLFILLCVTLSGEWFSRKKKGLA